MQNDVAILEFDEPLNDMPEYAKPVCIASTAHQGGEVAYVSGWGHTTQGIIKKIAASRKTLSSEFPTRSDTKPGYAATEDGKGLEISDL